MTGKEKASVYECPICGGAAMARSEERDVSYGVYSVPVRDEYMQCQKCHERFYLPGQMEEIDHKAGDYAKREMQVFLPWQITDLRERMGLNRVEFEHLLGTGSKTNIRWEQGRVMPNAVVNALLFLLEENPDNVRLLAGWRRLATGNEAVLEPAVRTQSVTSRLPSVSERTPADVLSMSSYLERRGTAKINVRIAAAPYTEAIG